MPQPSLGPAFLRQSNVYTDFYGDAQHHHRSHTYVYFYSNKAALLTNWTSKHIVSTVNKVNVNSVKCVSITLQSSPRVQLINTCMPQDGHSLATGQMYIATAWVFPATGQIYTATGRMYSELNWWHSG